MSSPRYFIPEAELLDRQGLNALQQRKLSQLLQHVLKRNPFYMRKLGKLKIDPDQAILSTLPLTTRHELEQDQIENEPPFGSNRTLPDARYVRYHQTSGSSGRPLRWLDTEQNWDWFKRCWSILYTAARVSSADTVVFPFSFGPFIGFWAAFEAALALGCRTIPAGGLTTSARLRLILDNNVDIICCTPTYALRMAEVAAQEHLDLR